ncbi:MAG: hypothetical protein Q4B85_06700 [Lachnospiraceae bacterium]|nr:hypothetical protein [Lachnospiraceae bacterium]
MANLIIGDGQIRSAANDAAIFTQVFGDGVGISSGGLQATTPDNNTVRLSSGLCVCEGRVITVDTYEDFAIPSTYEGGDEVFYVGFRIYKDGFGDKVEKYVGAVNPERGSLLSGDTDMYAILYKVPVSGINIGVPELLCDVINIHRGKEKKSMIQEIHTKVVTTRSTVSSVLWYTDNEIMDILGVQLTDSQLMGKVVVTAMNGHYEARNESPMCIERRVPDPVKDPKQTYQKGFWAHFNKEFQGSVRLTCLISAKV